ncbi:MAG: AI-2E family transporter [Cytophagales bacterium]|nr:AI-2E family transporter [Cytophagales bacterium]MDW8384547.1 AI-2E family transporter [Flammeovirgaceae bacterium]
MFFNKTFLNILIGLSIIGLLLWLLAGVVEYCLLALVLSAILRTPINYLTQWQILGARIPRTLAVILSFILLIFIIVLFFALFVPLILDQIEVLSKLNFSEIFAKIITPIDKIENYLLGIGLLEVPKGTLQNNILHYFTNWFEKLDITSFLNQLFSYTGSILAGAFATFFISFFLLNETSYIRKKLISFIPNRYFEVSITAIIKIEKLLSNYLLGLFLQMIAIFATCSLGLSIIGIHYALTVGVFTAVANLIPYIGPLLGAVFGVFVGMSNAEAHLISQDSLWILSKILVVFGIVQLIDNILLQPIIFSRSVKAHPLEIFLVVVIGANLLGAIGMVMAIPAYTVIKVSVKEFYQGYLKYRFFKKQADF